MNPEHLSLVELRVAGARLEDLLPEAVPAVLPYGALELQSGAEVPVEPFPGALGLSDVYPPVSEVGRPVYNECHAEFLRSCHHVNMGIIGA